MFRRLTSISIKRSIAPTSAVRVSTAFRGMSTVAKPMYTATSTASGGRKDGVVATDDGKVKFQLGFPKEMGGDGKNTNPEQLFSLGYAGCFHGALGFVHKKPLPAGTTVTIAVSLSKELSLSAEIKVALPGMEKAAAEKLLADAHAVCPYSRATKGNMPVTLTLV